jgi:hypothetical protein
MITPLKRLPSAPAIEMAMEGEINLSESNRDSENNNKFSQDSANQSLAHNCLTLPSFVALNLVPGLEPQKQVLFLRIKFLFNPTIEDAHVRMPLRLVHPRPEKLMFRAKGSRTPRRNTRSFLLFNSKTDNGLTKPLTSRRDGSRPICAMATRV